MGIASSGVQPYEGAHIGELVARVDNWSVTYNPHLIDGYLELMNELVPSGKNVTTVINFRDYGDLCAKVDHFSQYAIPKLPSGLGLFAEDFRKTISTMYNPDNFFDIIKCSFPFPGTRADVIFARVDTRFTRETPTSFKVPYPTDPSSLCSLGLGARHLSIKPDGKVLPCTSPAQNHVPPIIRNIDELAEIPPNLMEYINRWAERLKEVNNGICDMGCTQMDWTIE